jgi:hypothetical protein
MAYKEELELTRNDSRGCERNGESLRTRVPFLPLTSSHDHFLLTILTLLELAHATCMLLMSDPIHQRFFKVQDMCSMIRVHGAAWMWLHLRHVHA